MLTDFEFDDLGTRRDRASGAYFAATRLLFIVRPGLGAAPLAEAEALVSSLRDEYNFLRSQLSQEGAARREHARQQQALADADFAAAYEAQQRSIAHLLAA